MGKQPQPKPEAAMETDWIIFVGVGKCQGASSQITRGLPPSVFYSDLIIKKKKEKKKTSPAPTALRVQITKDLGGLGEKLRGPSLELSLPWIQ